MRRERDWAGLKGLVALVAIGALVGGLAGEAWGQGPDRVTAMLVTKDGQPREVIVYAEAKDPAEYHVQAFKACKVAERQNNVLLYSRQHGIRVYCVLDEPLAPYWLPDQDVAWNILPNEVVLGILEQSGVE